MPLTCERDAARIEEDRRKFREDIRAGLNDVLAARRCKEAARIVELTEILRGET